MCQQFVAQFLFCLQIKGIDAGALRQRRGSNAPQIGGGQQVCSQQPLLGAGQALDGLAKSGVRDSRQLRIELVGIML
ncbi:hypothetical protein D3C72_1850120 [compost metagenome]